MDSFNGYVEKAWTCRIPVFLTNAPTLAFPLGSVLGCGHLT